MQRETTNIHHSSTRLYISKEENELELLPRFCKEQHISLSTHSFLTFEATPFHIRKPFDVVFFASPRAIRFFFQQETITDATLIAVAGETTRKAVTDIGKDVHFSPTNSGSIEESTLEFSRWVTSKHVLFPTSDLSQKSYAQHLKQEQLEIVQAYKTQISTKKIEECNIYVFTSPSNVKGFLASNAFPENAIIIAWGETTYTALAPVVKTDSLFVLDQSTEASLMELIRRILFLE